MDRQIRECMDHLIEAIRNSSEYSSYRKSLEALDRFPGLSDRIMELRSKTIELYHEENAGDLMEDSEELGNEFAELEKMPEISEFLEAEEDMVYILNEVNTAIATSVDIRTPGMLS